MRPMRTFVTLALLAAFTAQAGAGPLRDRLLARRAQAQASSPGDESELREDGRDIGRAQIPDNVKVLRNIAYGNAERQKAGSVPKALSYRPKWRPSMIFSTS